MICKLCNREMKLRQAKQGKNAGNYFWGCLGFPACKGIQDATEQDVAAYKNAEAPKGAIENIDTATRQLSNSIARVFNESQSSYEFGKATNRHKVYYNDVKNLTEKIDELKQAGLVDNELEIHPEDFGKENE